MLHIALWEPEIPPNTGNIARLCAATGAGLHLIGRLGFRLDERSLRRAGLDYWPDVDVTPYPSVEHFERQVNENADGVFSGRIICFSAHVETPYTRIAYRAGDCLLFGSESRGLPARVLTKYAGATVTIFVCVTPVLDRSRIGKRPNSCTRHFHMTTLTGSSPTGCGTG